MKKRASPAVITYHQCSHSKDPELYCYYRMPRTDETRDLLEGIDTYRGQYESKNEDMVNRFKMLMKNEYRTPYLSIKNMVLRDLPVMILPLKPKKLKHISLKTAMSLMKLRNIRFRV